MSSVNIGKQVVWTGKKNESVKTNKENIRTEDGIRKIIILNWLLSLENNNWSGMMSMIREGL
jgi:hypothetical protein